MISILEKLELATKHVLVTHTQVGFMHLETDYGFTRARTACEPLPRFAQAYTHARKRGNVFEPGLHGNISRI